MDISELIMFQFKKEYVAIEKHCLHSIYLA